MERNSEENKSNNSVNSMVLDEEESIQRQIHIYQDKSTN